jgi:hypothetical protein
MAQNAQMFLKAISLLMHPVFIKCPCPFLREQYEQQNVAQL